MPTPLRPVVTQFSTASNSKRSTSPCAEKKRARGAEKLHEEICWRFCDPNRPKLPFHIPFILVQTCPNILSNDSPRYHQKSTSIQQNQAPTSSVIFFGGVMQSPISRPENFLWQEWWSNCPQPRRYTLSQHVETIANLSDAGVS